VGIFLIVVQQKQFCNELTAVENPRVITIAFFALTLLFHYWVALMILAPVEVVSRAVPSIIEVSMISQLSTRTTLTPQASMPAPAPTQVKPVETPKSKLSPVKKQRKKHIERRKQSALPKPFPAEAFTDAVTTNANVAPGSGVSKSSTVIQGHAESFTEANFDATYASNPKPVYPQIAKRRGWEGKVLLKVEVSTQGLSVSVTVHQSSGHVDLDEAAVAAVENWRFIPARRGNADVVSSVIVPIVFTLND